MSTTVGPSPLQVPLRIKVISQTGLLYFWHVWLTSFILAGLTYAEDTRLAVVPPGTTVKALGPNKVYELTVKETSPALADAAAPGNPSRSSCRTSSSWGVARPRSRT
jgi:hypothetical protein